MKILGIFLKWNFFEMEILGIMTFTKKEDAFQIKLTKNLTCSR
jgi:hypothetical protein